jgi:tRNA(Ile)-lysidine synthase
MLKALEKTLKYERLVKPGDRILCAVSGGADSVALLMMLNHLSAKLSFSLCAAHLDHRLRPESADDAAFVANLCQSIQVPLVSEDVDVQSLSIERREGLEATGRFARRRFLERVAAELQCSLIALAHHADDQAETVLFRLARGSGLTGLAAMRHRSGVYIRPLLNQRKVDLCNWLVENGIVWREDVSNLDPKFSRNLIRHQILPALRQVNVRSDEAICRFSHQVAQEECFWAEQVDTILSSHLRMKNAGELLTMSVSSLLTLHPALRRRVLRGIIERLRGGLQQLDASHLDQIELLLASSQPQKEAHLPGVWVARRYDDIVVRSEPPEFEPFAIEIVEAGSYLLPTGDRITVALQSDSELEVGRCAAEFCAEQILFPIIIRSAQPGDRFQPSGMDGHKRLKNYFIDNKISTEDRHKVPVVCAGNDIIWLAGERRCEGAWPVSNAPKLRMQFEPADFVDE